MGALEFEGASGSLYGLPVPLNARAPIFFGSRAIIARSVMTILVCSPTTNALISNGMICAWFAE